MKSIAVRQLRAPSKKTIFIGLISFIYIGAIVYLVDVGDVLSVLQRISWTSLAIATVLVVIANLLAFARSGAVLRALGFRSGWRDLFLAFSASNVSNLPLNVVGQSLTRAMVLVRAGIPFGVTVMATYVERILAAGLLFLFSLAGLWFLFGRVSFDFNKGGGEILSTIGGIVVVALAVGVVLFRRRICDHASNYLRWFPKLWQSALLTVLCHGAGLAAYVVLLTEFGSLGISFSLVSALAIVMFVTSLPISFAGWGLRELSAASTLGLIGISADVAVASAIAIGLLFLAATGLFAVFGLVLIAARRIYAGAGANVDADAEPRDAAPAKSDWDAKIIQSCAVLCAILMFFRVPTHLGTSDFPINVNVADVIIFLGLSVILLMIAAGRIKSLFPSFLTVALTGVSGVILLGLLVSWAGGNLGGWALYTRGVGWILMLGYAALGAAMVTIAGDRGRMLVLRCLIIAAMTICILQLVILAWSTFVVPVPRYVLSYPLQGFANNQNAFSFELVMVGVLLIVGRNIGLFKERQWMFTSAVALLALTIYFTGSRSGAVFVVVLALLDNFLARNWGRDGSQGTRQATGLAATAIVVAILLPYVLYLLVFALNSIFGIEINADAMFATLAQPDQQGSTRLLHPTADIERWDTIVGGLALWTEAPLLGAGLGAYVEWVRAAGQHVHGIHSVYIWLLSEMGLLGLLTVMALGALVTAGGWRMMTRPQSRPWGFVVIGVVSIMAIGGLVQDFFYQRMFWFLLGLAAVDTAGIEGASNAKTFMTVIITLGVVIFLLAL